MDDTLELKIDRCIHNFYYNNYNTPTLIVVSTKDFKAFKRELQSKVSFTDFSPPFRYRGIELITSDDINEIIIK